MTSSTTLLLDADIIAFKIASVSQKTFQFSPEDEPIVQVDDWSEVLPRIQSAILSLQETLDTRDVIVCLSCPTAENWRLDVLPSYKANRDYSKRPLWLREVKDYMEQNWPSYRRPRLEADDIMGILSTSDSIIKGRKIIVSEDKDMKTIPGWLFNPAQDTRPQHVDAAMADYWHLYQTICGDTVDGYTGCPKAGPEKAKDCLGGYVYVPEHRVISRGPRKGTQETRWTIQRAVWGYSTWDRVVSLYERYGYTEEDALVQARVSRICRDTDYDFNRKEVILWTPQKTRLLPQ